MRNVLVAASLTFGFAQLSSAQTVNSSFLGTRWDKPGPAAAVFAPPFGNGEASWSIIAMGVGLQPGLPDNDHPAGALTLDFDGLLPAANIRRPAAIFADALSVWQNGSGSAWKSLGQVADGGGLIGGPVQAMSGVGDIRAAVLRFLTPPPVESHPDVDLLAHAFRPNTVALNADNNGFGSVGGDIHIRPSNLQDVNNGINWVDDPNAGFGAFDLETVMIHEIGHAIGLGHNTGDANSVMQPLYTGPKRNLSATDIQNVTQLYTRVVPEPSTILGLAAGLGLLIRRRRNRAST